MRVSSGAWVIVARVFGDWRMWENWQGTLSEGEGRHRAFSPREKVPRGSRWGPYPETRIAQRSYEKLVLDLDLWKVTC